MHTPLRVGIMLDGLTVPAWMAESIRDIVAGHYAELSLLIVNSHLSSAPLEKKSRFRRLVSGELSLENLNQALFWRYQAYDHARTATQPDAFAAIDVSSDVSGASRIDVRPLRTKYVDRFARDDIDAIKAHDLDVILRFGFRILKGDILTSARYGVWSFHHGDNRFYRGGPAYFWEIFRGEKTAGLILQRIQEQLDNGTVLYRSTSSVELKSLWATRNPIFWKSRSILRRCLVALQRDGADAFFRNAFERYADSRCGPIFRTPGNITMLILACKLFLRRVARPDSLVRRQWFIGLRKRRSDDEWGSAEWARRFQFIPSERGHFFADPFLLERKDDTWVFFEDYSWKSEKGKISCAKIEPDGSIGKKQTALECLYHLSNPFVFELDGQIYMVPETVANKRVELYRCVDFPDRWRSAAVLLDGSMAVDPCLFKYRDTWWLAAVVADVGCSTWDELHIFSAKELFGPWQAHPMNPVVSDVTQARPAGRIFERNGDLFRLAQDCSGGYGKAVHLCRITDLSTTNYRQEIVGRLDPAHFGMGGVHAYDATEQFEVVDGRRNWVVLGPWHFRWPLQSD